MTVQIERFVFQSLDGDADFGMTPMSVVDLAVRAVPPGTTIAQEVPVEPTFSIEELERYKQEAYANGFKAATKEAEQRLKNDTLETEKTISSLLSAIASRLEGMHKDRMQLLEYKKRELSDIVISIARKVAGAAMKQQPLAPVEKLLEQCLATFMDDAKITLFVHPTLCAALQKKLPAMITNSGYTGEIVVNADSELSREDCRVEWPNGQAEHHNESLWQQIETLIRNAPLTATPASKPNEEDGNTVYLANR
jgi:flagellar biosynthesis/type III secretory pathway protein FliH